MKWGIILLFAALLSPWATAQTATECMSMAIHREAASEGYRGAVAVLQVIRTRMKLDHKTACQVVMSPGAFPWSAYNTNWKLSKYILQRYQIASKMPDVLPDGVYYFNNRKMKLGRFCCKIKHHYFYYKE